jgi:Fic family protein
MASVGKKTIKGKTYYYLEHSFRKNGKIQKKVVYLGDKIPKNIDDIKTKFLNEIYPSTWKADVDKIRKNYSKEQKIKPKTVKEKELQAFATRFTYDTQRIEGSTLTRRETADLLERGITPARKPLTDVKEAEAHRDLFYEILQSKRDITLQMMIDWHWKLFHNTKPDIAGKIRKYQVAISGSKFLPPSPVEVNPMLAEFFQWYNKNKNKLHPVELAAIAHLKFVTIHPFGDGNGRISRLVMNFILNKKNYPMMDISYEERNGYYNSLERSQVKQEEGIFLRWFIGRYLREYKSYLK